MITETFDGRTLVLIFENGVNANGDPLYVRKSFKYFTEAATIEQIHTIGMKLATLYDLPLSQICTDEDHILTM